MTASTVAMVATATPNPAEMEAMQSYLQQIGPLLGSRGGRPVYRGKINKQLIGDSAFQMLIVMEFESAEIIEEIFESPEYAALIPVRDKGFKNFSVLISSST
jgi:uncharacterized protein (DUF1330 family)